MRHERPCVPTSSAHQAPRSPRRLGPNLMLGTRALITCNRGPSLPLLLLLPGRGPLWAREPIPSRRLRSSQYAKGSRRSGHRFSPVVMCNCRASRMHITSVLLPARLGDVPSAFPSNTHHQTPPKSACSRPASASRAAFHPSRVMCTAQLSRTHITTPRSSATRGDVLPQKLGLTHHKSPRALLKLRVSVQELGGRAPRAALSPPSSAHQAPRSPRRLGPNLMLGTRALITCKRGPSLPLLLLLPGRGPLWAREPFPSRRLGLANGALGLPRPLL